MLIHMDYPNTQQTYNVASTSLQCRCNVVTLQRRCNDVVCLLGKCYSHATEGNKYTFSGLLKLVYLLMKRRSTLKGKNPFWSKFVSFRVDLFF